jgi:hypothetical protein
MSQQRAVGSWPPGKEKMEMGTYYRSNKPSRFGKCRSCGAPIMWIRTEKGKMMPVDMETERFYPDPRGEKLYIMNDGHTMRGTPAPEGEEILPCVASGFVSHFATCPDAGKFRKRDASE